MQNAAVEKIGDGRKPNMGMRTHVYPLSRRKLNRAEMIVKDKRPDHLAPVVGQGAPDAKAAEIARARRNL